MILTGPEAQRCRDAFEREMQPFYAVMEKIITRATAKLMAGDKGAVIVKAELTPEAMDLYTKLSEFVKQERERFYGELSTLATVATRKAEGV